MNVLKHFFNLSLFMGLTTLSFICNAGCWYTFGNTHNYSYTVNITSLSVASNQQPNTPLGPVMSIPQGGQTFFACHSAPVNMMTKFSETLTESAYPGIYKTNVAGIGIKVWVESSSNVVGNNLSVYGKWPTSSFGSFVFGKTYAQFYVIDVVSKDDGPLMLDFTVEGWINNTVSTSGGIKTADIKFTSDIPVTVKSCETPDISVDLKKHSKSDFASVGSTSAATPFNFAIKKCSKDMAAVKYTFKPAAGINLVNSGGSDQYITLRSGSTASGVGIQVLYANDTLVPFNSAVKYTGYNPSLGGDYVIPMKARYIRTGEVSPGSANSAVEFMMSYE
ncbi:TPA: type 1 fimbrial protein [Kluyvera intermedia]|uniref:Fimbrial-type adhesion domain-containing protein n=2 Tax=Enterobacteriaceae TaxID=543 RepID=A0AAC8QS79_9ENTR|nr:fimbrial protein [Phytobacter ursingii]HAT2206338.1 type 1 fimbrial protein [Kluyvera intermedia]AKL13881.1 hypothetical protein AB182_22445 [Phytobacter ursingii]HAT2517012.1 type 1 fimbrial protein [Kluyvera intermedia]HAT2605520.1 type 1 fimbrial protein [Kluyvera intermedia]HAT2682351.1 type 1 fimbrial protein [Kluyvera intermedia]